MKNTDQLIEQMKRDELEGAEVLGISDMAKVLGVAPQLLHYYIRRKKLEVQRCACGRHVLPVSSTIDFFRERGK